MKLKEEATNKTYFIEDCIQYYKIVKEGYGSTIWRSFKNRKHSRIISIKTNKITTTL